MAIAASHARATSAVMAEAVAGAASVKAHANPTKVLKFLTGTSFAPSIREWPPNHIKKARSAQRQSSAELSRGLPCLPQGYRK
ncbi:hypothetical protein [Bradyrhizobium zhanjiangense]|uniref:hypothetical protein n=1 Tax=Bradyrhizobium zhanjiangense TaxID=1325107 RepID=UPI0013E8AD9E|nr:hypothetical protein [Bradyrhizobium zhanjiangense]